jgi:large subunit ribosomal protein L15
MTMRLNDMKPATGARKTRRRVGRGASAGPGKTAGRGVKGQRARKGGYHKVGFEGGQMPIQRRMPKVGFRSKMFTAEVRLDELLKVDGTAIDIDALKKANIIPTFADRAKVVLSGEITKAVNLKGIGTTKGAKEAIEKAGGTVEALPEPPKPAKLTAKAKA